MKSPDQIQKLITELSQSSIEDYNAILNSFDFNTIDFTPFESWSSEKYTRNCLFRDGDFELILLCWDQGQETSIHGHDGEDCWVYLLDGAMEEEFFTIDTHNYLRKERSRIISPNQLTFMNDNIGFHKLRNSNTGKSISLHLYAKPIKNCCAFDETTNRFIKRELHYDTFKQNVLK